MDYCLHIHGWVARVGICTRQNFHVPSFGGCIIISYGP